MVKEINSAANPSFKGWHGLIEGEVLIGEALKEGRGPKDVLLRRSGIDPDSMEERIDSILRNTKEGYPVPNIYLLSDELFYRLSQTENGRDIIGVMEKPLDYKELLKKRLKSKRLIGNILVLDRLQDPGNVGTIIRSADAFGISGIGVIKGSADIYGPKTVRAAAGSILRVPIIQLDNEDELFALAEELGLKVVATGLKKAETFYETDLKENLAIVIGNEGQGVSETILGRAEKIIKIPMEGAIDSLNAAIAASVILYECVRQKSIERG